MNQPCNCLATAPCSYLSRNKEPSFTKATCQENLFFFFPFLLFPLPFRPKPGLTNHHYPNFKFLQSHVITKTSTSSHGTHCQGLIPTVRFKWRSDIPHFWRALHFRDTSGNNFPPPKKLLTLFKACQNIQKHKNMKGKGNWFFFFFN